MTKEQITQIEKIVERVINEHLRNTQQSDKKLLVIIGATQQPLEQALKQLQICHQDGWKITIICSNLATKTVNLEPIYSIFGKENILQENSIDDIISLVEENTQIILPALAYPMAGKLALKLVDTPCTYLIFHALSSGKKVIVVSDILSTKKYINKKTIDLEKIEQIHVNALTDFGVKWVTVDNISETVNENYLTKRANIDTPIISANVIANLDYEVNELVYTKPVVITPLARENAQKRGIRLIPKNESM